MLGPRGLDINRIQAAAPAGSGIKNQMEVENMERTYYSINEKMAWAANNANSMRDYKEGSATAEYKNYVNKVYECVEQIAEEKPHLLEKAIRMAERYSRKLSIYYNDYYRNEAACPSILISGAGNFPVRKKEKQNSRRDTLHKEWEYLESYARKIENLLTMKQPILSGDEQAVELLQEKLDGLVETQEMMKAVNAYYRKEKTLDGCPNLTQEEIEKLKADMASSWHWADVPYLPYELTNNNANIKRTRDRLESLKKVKEAGTQETESEFCKVVENTEIMRLQLIFDEKPEAEVREILKRNGFRWAPSHEAWQRQLTNNARYAMKQVMIELKKLQEEAV